MNQPRTERRSGLHRGASGLQYDAGTIERALELQTMSSTLSAVEYLKDRGVDAAVIYRVLTSAARRGVAQAVSLA